MRMIPRFTRSLALAAAKLAAASAAAGLLAVPAATHAVDFDGARISWMIPFKEGSEESDTWARFYAPLLAENLPGAPVIAVKNVPGGGSTTGANQFQSRARPDGREIFGTSGSTQFPYLLGDKRVKYEYKDWIVVLASATGGVLYVSSDLGVKGAEDLAKLQGQALTYGAQSATGLDLIPLLAFDMLGLEVKSVFGMKGRGAGRLAFERGETNIDYQTSSAYLKKSMPLVEEGKAVPLMSWGAMDDEGNLVRDPTFPDLPHFAEAYEMMHGKPPAGPAWEAWKSFFVAGFAAQKMIFLPNGTPDDIVVAWREAARKTVTAPGFAEKAALVLGDYPQSTGPGAEKRLKTAINVDPAAREWVRNWLTENFKVRL